MEGESSCRRQDATLTVVLKTCCRSCRIHVTNVPGGVCTYKHRIFFWRGEEPTMMLCFAENGGEEAQIAQRMSLSSSHEQQKGRERHVESTGAQKSSIRIRGHAVGGSRSRRVFHGQADTHVVTFSSHSFYSYSHTPLALSF